MEFIKEILKRTLKGEYELPKAYRCSEDDSPYSICVEYADLVVIRLYDGYNKIKYNDISLESRDKELSELIREVEQYVMGKV